MIFELLGRIVGVAAAAGKRRRPGPRPTVDGRNEDPEVDGHHACSPALRQCADRIVRVTASGDRGSPAITAAPQLGGASTPAVGPKNFASRIGLNARNGR